MKSSSQSSSTSSTSTTNADDEPSRLRLREVAADFSRCRSPSIIFTDTAGGVGGSSNLLVVVVVVEEAPLPPSGGAEGSAFNAKSVFVGPRCWEIIVASGGDSLGGRIADEPLREVAAASSNATRGRCTCSSDSASRNDAALLG